MYILLQKFKCCFGLKIYILKRSFRLSDTLMSEDIEKPSLDLTKNSSC